MNEKPSILLVEDDAEMRETLSDILLDKKGYVVIIYKGFYNAPLSFATNSFTASA